MANDMIRVEEDADDLTCQVTAGVTGKRFVKISAARSSKFNVLAPAADGNNYRVAHCGAGQVALGVSKYDQATVTGKVGVARGGICVVTAGANLTAGTECMSDANGKAIPYASGAVTGAAPGDAVTIAKPLGIVMDDALNNADSEILVYE